MSHERAKSPRFGRHVAWQSQTVFERARLCEASDAVDPGDARAESEEFFESWCEHAFDGDRDALGRRLQAAPVSEAQCRAAFGVEAWPEDVTLPDWLDRLHALVDGVAEYEGARCTGDDDQPFGHVLAPWVEWAWDDLTAERSFHRFSDRAVAELKLWLLRRLGALCSDPLYVQFQAFLSARRPSLVFSGPPEEGEPSTECYEAFVAMLTQPEKLHALFREYPVLGRFVATTLRQWRTATIELHRRLDDDWETLVDAFAPDAAPERVRDLAPDEGDRHHDGRAVVEVELTEDATVYYKPRSVEPERLCYSLFERVASAVDHPVSVPECRSRSEYGWVEEIPAAAPDETDLETYFRGAGVLLAVAQVLVLTDCHYENLIATEHHPAVVDAETLLHPELAIRDEPSADAWPDTVIQTGLLPGSLDDDRVDQIAGLVPPRVTPDAAFTGREGAWEHANTDWMTPSADLEDPDVTDLPADNVPVRDGDRIGLEGHECVVEAGFADAYERFLEDDPLLEELADELSALRTRVVYTATSSYGRVRNALTSTDCLEDGTAVTLELETLTSGFGDEDVDDDAILAFHRAERTALKRLDVPRFEADATGSEVYFDGHSIGSVVETPGVETFRKRREALSRDDLALQRDLVQLSTDPERVPALTRRDDPLCVDPAAPTTIDDGRLEAIAGDVVQHSRAERRTAQGEPVWLDLDVDVDGSIDADGAVVTPDPDDKQLSLSITDDEGIYDGRGGIAVFFAAADAVAGVDGARDAALTTIEPLRSQLAAGDLEADTLGMASGTGAHVYALTLVGELLGEPALLEDARRAAAAVTPERVATDRNHDVLGGSAGAALALLALADRTGDQRVLDRAVRCGEALLEARVETDTDHRAWPTTSAPWPLTGFAHGAAGVAYALYRLAGATGEDRFRRAGREALAYETALYDTERRNWPDRRETSGPFMDAWCHGRAGSLLSRVAIQEQEGATPFVEDLPGIADRVGGDDDQIQQQLCCGAAGRAVILDDVGVHLGEDRYVERAHGLLDRASCVADEVGTHLIPFHTSRLYKPGLFMGTAGVGYAALRLRDRSTVPNVLLFE